MASAGPGLYRQCAMARLARAEELYRSINPEARATAFCELAQVASLIWDAVIDAISVAYTVGGGEPSGKSAQMREYAKEALPIAYRYWKGPIRLHNFQHRPYQRIELFDEHCEDTAGMLANINDYLPGPLRLPPESFDWLPETANDEEV